MQKLSKICDCRILEFTVSTLKRTEKVSFDRVESEVGGLWLNWKVQHSWRWKWTVHSLDSIRLKIEPKSSIKTGRSLPLAVQIGSNGPSLSSWANDLPPAKMEHPVLVGPFCLNLAFSWNTVFIRVLSHLHHDQSKFMSHLNDSQVSILFLTALQTNRIKIDFWTFFNEWIHFL